jgi:replicative DNA helicase
LGAILLDNLAYTEGAKYRLQVKDFALDSHRRIYARMVDLAESARPIDMITLRIRVCSPNKPTQSLFFA